MEKKVLQACGLLTIWKFWANGNMLHCGRKVGPLSHETMLLVTQKKNLELTPCCSNMLCNTDCVPGQFHIHYHLSLMLPTHSQARRGKSCAKQPIEWPDLQTEACCSNDMGKPSCIFKAVIGKFACNQELVAYKVTRWHAPSFLKFIILCWTSGWKKPNNMSSWLMTLLPVLVLMCRSLAMLMMLLGVFLLKPVKNSSYTSPMQMRFLMISCLSLDYSKTLRNTSTWSFVRVLGLLLFWQTFTRMVYFLAKLVLPLNIWAAGSILRATTRLKLEQGGVRLRWVFICDGFILGTPQRGPCCQ